MRKSLPLSVLLSLLALAGCTSGSTQINQSLLDNPLFAQYYYDELQQNMMNLQIQGSPILQDDSKKKIVAKALQEATQKAQEVSRIRRQGKLGSFLGVDQGLQGQALLLDGKIFLSPDFSVLPGPSVHIFASPVIDPRVGGFPDASAVDLGILRNPYGPDTYALPSDHPDIRTVVIFDTELKSVYGFAQMQVQE